VAARASHIPKEYDNGKGRLLSGPDIRCRRLLFRCWHRGTQENDLILGAFAETSLARLDSNQLDRFEALLDCPTPICSTGSWAAAGRRQSTIMTSCGCCAASAPRAVTDRPSTTDRSKAEN